MNTCKHCGEPLKHVSGRKKKQFCNTNCRNKWFYHERKRLIEAVKEKIDGKEWDNALINAARGRDKKGVNKDEVKVADLTKPNVEKKPIEQPKTNYSINTIPKTLEELKLLCPKELTGFDRSQWIAAERQKYGI